MEFRIINELPTDIHPTDDRDWTRQGDVRVIPLHFLEHVLLRRESVSHPFFFGDFSQSTMFDVIGDVDHHRPRFKLAKKRSRAGGVVAMAFTEVIVFFPLTTLARMTGSGEIRSACSARFKEHLLGMG